MKISEQSKMQGKTEELLRELQKANKNILENDIDPIMMIHSNNDDEPFATTVILSEKDPHITALRFSCLVQRFVEIMEEKKADTLNRVRIKAGDCSLDELKKDFNEYHSDVLKEIDHSIEKLEDLKKLIGVYADKFISLFDEEKKEGEKENA